MAPDYYKKASVCRIVDANFEEAPFRALGRIRARRGGASVPRLSGYLPPLSKEAENGGATQACAASGSYAQGEEGTSPKSVISEGRALPISQNANCRQFMILHRNGACGMSERSNVFSEADPVFMVA